jgi:adenine phosphoribosyltransferase
MDLSEAISFIRPIENFPKDGILFQDITPALANPAAFETLVSAFASLAENIDYVVGIEARGFIFAAAVASKNRVGFIPIRKSGKLPFATHSRSYGLEYGDDELHIHIDALAPGARVLLIDDVLATGGTLVAGIELVHALSAQVTDVAVLLEISALAGRAKISSGYPDIQIHSLAQV